MARPCRGRCCGDAQAERPDHRLRQHCRRLRSQRPARQLAAARYEAGVTDFFSLLDAERERLVAQDRLIQLQVGRATALLAVHKAFAAGLTTNP